MSTPVRNGAQEGPHSSHCFVVMPFGRNQEERKWFSGWYEVVIKPAIEQSGYDSILAAAEDQPGAINDEIRSHLALDPLVIVDLAGRNSDDPPNPNVMYELGIRHAFGLPVVVLAWEGQNLPFDVGNQRAIMCQRGFKDIEPVKAKIKNFIAAAESGNFYNPMDVVGREAALDTAKLALGEESALAALIAEVRYLKDNLSKSGRGGQSRKRLIVKNALGKSMRSDLLKIARDCDFDNEAWSKFISMKLSEDMFRDAKGWGISDWADFLKRNQPARIEVLRDSGGSIVPSQVSANFVDLVDGLLGEQPWPKGEARLVAEKLEVSTSKVGKAIKILMQTGRRRYQKNGVLFDSEAEYRSSLDGDF